MSTLPIIGIMADYRQEEGREWIKLPHQYLLPVQKICGAVPLLIPPLSAAAHPEVLEALLSRLDGVILSGSPSNIQPEHYGQEWQTPDLPQDPLRDATSLALIPKILERQMPLLGICRGFQEINVALGGTLHQSVHNEKTYRDHRAPQGKSLPEQFETLQHTVSCAVGGTLATLLGTTPFLVNSLHGQGVMDLAPNLVVEARAEDGLVEAYSQPHYASFFLAVQWHPEWKAWDNPQSKAIFEAFGQSCRVYAQASR